MTRPSTLKRIAGEYEVAGPIGVFRRRLFWMKAYKNVLGEKQSTLK